MLRLVSSQKTIVMMISGQSPFHLGTSSSHTTNHGTVKQQLASSISSLAQMFDSPGAPSFGTKTLACLVDGDLADHHFKPIHGAWEIKGYSPNNTYLLNSLLSGLSLKYGLASTPDMHAALNDGLDARPGSEDSQALVVGTCIRP